jgi:hypothetical protein
MTYTYVGVAHLLRRRFLFALPMPLLHGVAVRADAQEGFDHSHAAWTALLRRHVQPLRGGVATAVRYAGLAEERAALQRYLHGLSALSPAAYARFGRSQQQAFLINAYNAFTVELVLTRWPDLKSIKDLGSLWQSPWKRKWVRLLGTLVSLDDIEHGMLRKPGAFDDPRIHFGVNCASIGCPALREEAFVAERLDAQLDDMARRFLSDRTRNRYHVPRGRLEVSKIFDWFGEDFRAGHRGITSLAAFVAGHADVLADEPAARERIRAGQVPLSFLDYDWALNDVR